MRELDLTTLAVIRGGEGAYERCRTRLAQQRGIKLLEQESVQDTIYRLTYPVPAAAADRKRDEALRPIEAACALAAEAVEAAKSR